MIQSWSGWYWKLGLASLLAIGQTLANPENYVLAQIRPDSTLGTESSVVTPNVVIRGLPGDRIDGGAKRGANLFHSFLEFNVAAGRGAYFTNPAGIENIISRVSGSNPSNIFGKLGVLGNANLFLINPNGIVFGPNASLDVGGSFVASTASSLKFADGTEFSATAPQITPLLTISVPIGLQFGGKPGIILNQSQATDTSGNTIGLQVQPDKTLALVGGDVALEGGSLTAPEGRIELGSVAGNGIADLTAIDKGWALGYAGVQNFGNIQLSQGAYVDASGEGGGNIQLQGGRIMLTDGSILLSGTLGAQPGGEVSIRADQLLSQDGSLISTTTLGTGRGGDITVTAPDFVEVRGTSADGYNGGFETTTGGAGAAGDLSIFTGRLIVRDGAVLKTETVASSPTVTNYGGAGTAGNLTINAKELIIQGSQVSSSTFGKGHAGNLAVTASDSVDLIGTLADGYTASGLFAESNNGAEGAGGSLTIQTGRLSIRDGAGVITSTKSSGNAGDLRVHASQVELSGTSTDGNTLSGLFTDTSERSSGNAGVLRIETGQLIVRDRAVVSASTLGSGNGGDIQVQADAIEAVNRGQIVTATEGSGQAGNITVNKNGRVSIDGAGSGILVSTSANSTGNGGNVYIDTLNLNLTDGGRISSQSQGTGSAGNLEVQASSIRLDDKAFLSADTTAGQGNINLRSGDLILRRGSDITTNATGTSPSGNIKINTSNLVAVPQENSDISANATESSGGSVSINAQGIFGTQFRQKDTPLSDITATSALGPQFSGIVQINTPIIDPSRGVATLPAVQINTNNLIAKTCVAGRDRKGGSFIITGNGGLPARPRDALVSPYPTGIVRSITSSRASNDSPVTVTATPPFPPAAVAIVPATGWVFNDKGQVLLTAQAPSATLYIPWLTPTSCHAR